MSIDGQKIYKRISELIESNSLFAIACVVACSKNSRLKVGTRMLVLSSGTSEFDIDAEIADENMKDEIIEKCQQAIKEKKNTTFICQSDSETEIFVEVFAVSERVIIFGGGHIGFALSGIFDILEMPYIVVDDRKNFAAEKRFPNAEKVYSMKYEDIHKIEINKNTYCIIVTHAHSGDKTVLKLLEKTSAAYIGLIGSRIKTKKIIDALKNENIEINKKRLHSPIGLELGGDSPAEIAIAIASEILTVKYKKSGVSLTKR